MTRIIGGVLGSLRLKGPVKATRPTSDRVKESVFSILESMGVLKDANVIDLFAGTGALGLEAASRGAAKVTLVERDRDAAAICKENLEKVRVGLEKAEVSCELVFQNNVAEKFVGSPTDASLVFIDPPYEMTQEKVMEILSVMKSGKDVTIVLERSGKENLQPLPEGVEFLREASYGDTVVYFLTKGASR